MNDQKLKKKNSGFNFVNRNISSFYSEYRKKMEFPF